MGAPIASPNQLLAAFANTHNSNKQEKQAKEPDGSDQQELNCWTHSMHIKLADQRTCNLTSNYQSYGEI